MSFPELMVNLRDVLLKDAELSRHLRRGLTRVGQSGRLDFQGCVDQDALSLSLIPVAEEEDNDTLTFGEKGEGEPESNATIQVEYRVLLRFRFEKSTEDRIEDTRGKPGLLNLVRLAKNAMLRDYTIGVGDEVAHGVDFRVISTTYPVATPQVQADLTVGLTETVLVGHREP